MNTIYTYDGNEQETYTIFADGEFFAHVDANEDDVMLIVFALNELN